MKGGYSDEDGYSDEAEEEGSGSEGGGEGGLFLSPGEETGLLGDSQSELPPLLSRGVTGGPASSSTEPGEVTEGGGAGVLQHLQAQLPSCV